LLTDLDVNVFIDLLAHHGDSLFTLLTTILLLTLTLGLVGIGLTAMVVAAVAEDGGLRAWTRRAVDLYPTYVALAVPATVFDVGSVLGAYSLGRAAVRWTAESTSEMPFYAIVAGATLLGAGLLLFFTTVHDHARIHCMATGSGAVHAYGWGLRYVAWRERRALPLAVLLLGAGCGLWAVYQSVGMLIRTNAGLGLGVSLVWGELLLLVRMLLRVWLFAAESELQNLTDRVPDS
jgi:hypothetical protein